MREACRESLHAVPIILFLKRNGDMQALAPGAFQHGLQAFALEPFLEILRGQFDGLEGNVGRGVEIEYHPVRMVDIFDAGAPGMDFNPRSEERRVGKEW